jgi:hypothetical protein
VIRGLSRPDRIGRLEIPASVRRITATGFQSFNLIEELVFAEVNEIVEMRGFQNCAIVKIVNPPRVSTFARRRSFVEYSVDAMTRGRRRAIMVMCKHTPGSRRRPMFGLKGTWSVGCARFDAGGAIRASNI